MSEEKPESEQEDKTEEPTAKRLEESRKKGQVVISRELSSWMLLLTIAVMTTYLFPKTAKTLSLYLAQFFDKTDVISITPLQITKLETEWIWGLIKVLGVPFLLLCIVSIITMGAQTGFVVSTDHIKPKFSRISIKTGLDRIFSQRSALEFIKGILKLTIVGAAIFIAVSPFVKNNSQMIFLEVSDTLSIMIKIISTMIFTLVGILSVVAILDYIAQYRQYMKKMRMTREEIKKEIKESEGDPHIKSKLKELRQSRSRRRMMADVPNAAVVITNPTHFAVALEYRFGKTETPIVIAKGQDFVALRIREIAIDNNIPLVQNPPLARHLHKDVEIGDPIHPDHYEAVAEVIRYVMSLKENRL